MIVFLTGQNATNDILKEGGRIYDFLRSAARLGDSVGGILSIEFVTTSSVLIEVGWKVKLSSSAWCAQNDVTCTSRMPFYTKKSVDGQYSQGLAIVPWGVSS